MRVREYVNNEINIHSKYRTRSIDVFSHVAGWLQSTSYRNVSRYKEREKERKKERKRERKRERMKERNREREKERKGEREKERKRERESGRVSQ
jgi:hypothetical protein